MAEMYRVAVPGTGQFIEVPPVASDIGNRMGQESRTVIIPGRLPRRFTEIVAGSTEGAHWLDGDFGPRLDPDGCVFLGRAIGQIGAALKGADWLGTEPAVNQTLSPLPDRARPFDTGSETVSPADRDAALDLLKGTPGRSDIRRDRISDYEWRVAQQMRAEAIAYVTPARDRLKDVFDTIESAFATGQLVARLQPLQGGETSTGRPAAEWLAPQKTVWGRLLTCRMDPSRPFDAKSGTHWIYVEKPGLNRLVTSLRKPAPVSYAENKLTRTLAHADAFVRRVKDAVKAAPQGPSQREALITEGYEIYRLPKEHVDRLYKDAVDHAGVPHEWSRPGPARKKANT